MKGGDGNMAYNILKIRKEKKMTQKELVEKSGISRATISKLENGEEIEVKVSTLVSIANALGVAWPELVS